jgi:hypothetical protein
MNHFGPMYQTQDISDWTASRLAEWIAEHPDWAGAKFRACSCEICGETVELVRPAEN